MPLNRDLKTLLSATSGWKGRWSRKREARPHSRHAEGAAHTQVTSGGPGGSSGLLCPEEREAVFHSYKRTDLFFQKVTSEVGRMDRMGPTYCLQASYQLFKALVFSSVTGNHDSDVMRLLCALPERDLL